MTYDIFISYRREENRWLAYSLQSELELNGFRVFLDTQDSHAGEDFPIELESCIKNCKDFILVLNKHTLDKCVDPADWIYKEVCIAIANKKHIVPLTTEPFDWSIDVPEDIKSITKRNEFKYYPIEHVRILMKKLIKELSSRPLKKYTDKIQKGMFYILLIACVGGASSYITYSYSKRHMGKYKDENFVTVNMQRELVNQFSYEGEQVAIKEDSIQQKVNVYNQIISQQ